jgi:hypothetical protein
MFRDALTVRDRSQVWSRFVVVRFATRVDLTSGPRALQSVSPARARRQAVAVLRGLHAVEAPLRSTKGAWGVWRAVTTSAAWCKTRDLDDDG